MKSCTVCGVEKPLDDFYQHEKRSDGRHSACKPCHNERGRRWAEANPERRKEHGRNYLARDPERARQKWRRANIKKYGLTVEEYDSRIARGCDICRRADGEMCIDHDHESGKLRGVLCGPCNRAIGLLRDDPELARGAARYLDHWSALLCTPTFFS